MRATIATSDIGVLYSQHAVWLRRWLQGRTRCHEWAADITQDTFRRLIEHHDDAVVRDPRNLLTVIARRLLIDDVRRREVERAYLSCHAALCDDTETLTPERIAEAVQLLDGLAALLAGMPDQVREAFLLRRLERLTHAEIADRLGVSDRTVKRHIARAFAHCYAYAFAE